MQTFARWLFAGLTSLTLMHSVACGQAVYRLADPPVVADYHRPVDTAVTMDEVLQRLVKAERRIAELEENEEVVDYEGWDLSSLFVMYDPEIGIAREQSYQGSQEPPTVSGPEAKEKAKDAPKPKKWYDKLSLRGYAQFRINEVLSMEDGSAPAQYVGDRSIGDNQSFLIRRARLIISGDVHERLYVYLQPDFASTPPGSTDATFFAQIRDWYGDVYFDLDKVLRLRIGQSKVPYGWENMQSSSNRIPLDRADSLNSTVRNERDLGMFLYYTPTWAQDFFKEVLEQGLKGSGNYGLFGIGVYNGQGGSLLEQNDNLHVVSRLTLPMTLHNGQFVEVGVQGYYGEYVVLSSIIDPPGAPAPNRPLGTLERARADWVDKRVAGTFVWYPQPLGFQAEWNVGRSPALNAAQTAIEERALYGGYAMLNYKYDTDCHGLWYPFVRYNYHEGGYKSERNAPYTHIREWETGVEWQINPSCEWTVTYLLTDRTNTTANSAAGSTSYGQFEGTVLRTQFQINY